ncbi:MAG: hypothetical protein QNJ54_21885 [Prochloraceae cyanobacterium]|nr:hypothetical protein [Prochloraceae cyanobacterium]
MGKYPEIIQQLIGAAYDQGLFEKSQIFAYGALFIFIEKALL